MAALLWLARPLPLPRILQITQLTHDATPKENVFTDGSRIYISEVIGAKHFLVQAAATGGDTSAVPNPLFGFYPTDISPDNSQLVGPSYGLLPPVTDQQVWLLPLPNGAPRRLGDIVASSAVWSPDQTQIALCKGKDIWLVASDGTNPRLQISLAGSPAMLSFSPDGARLRFTLNGSIWEVQRDGKNLHDLIPGWHNSEQKCCGVWTRDGRYYLLVSSTGSNSEIYALPEPRWPFHRHPEPVKLTSGPMLFTFGVPTPDGKKFSADGFIPRFEVVRYDDHAKGFVPLLSGISADELDFSRDGKWVVYVTTPDRALWRSRVDGSERLQLTSPPNSPLLPHWSPDGTQIV